MATGDQIRQSNQPSNDRGRQETRENTESGNRHSRSSSRDDLWQRAAREREQLERRSQDGNPFSDAHAVTSLSFDQHSNHNADRLETDSSTDTEHLIPRNMQETKRRYKEVKNQIWHDWPGMLASRTPKESYDFTVEFKNLRNQKKSEWKRDPNDYVDKFVSLQERMLNQDNMNAHTGPLKRISPAELTWKIYKYYPKVLSKLQALDPNGLGPGNSQTELINMYNDIKGKINKTALKLTGLSFVFGATYGISSIATEKKHINLLRSAKLYDNWMIELDRKLDAFQGQNQ